MEKRQRSKTGRKLRAGNLQCPKCGFTFEIVSGLFTDDEWEDICTCPCGVRMIEPPSKGYRGKQ